MKPAHDRGRPAISARDAFIAVVLVVTVVLVPLGGSELVETRLALPGAFAATIIFEVVSLVLIWQQFLRTGNRRYLVIAVGFVYAVVDEVFWLLAVPGLVSQSDTGVFSVVGGPVFVGSLWPIFSLVIGLAIAKWPRRWTATVPAWGRASVVRAAMLASLVISLLLMGVALYVVPRFIDGSDFGELEVRAQLGSLPLALIGLGFAVTGRHRDALLRWALVVPYCAVCIELLYLAGADRYSLGWYSAKVLTVLVSGILAVVLLSENAASYRRALEQASQSEALLSRTLSAAGAPVALVRREDGEWLVDYASDGARKQLGLAAPVTAGHPAAAPSEWTALFEEAVWQGQSEEPGDHRDGRSLLATAVAVGSGRVAVTWQGESAAQRAKKAIHVVRLTDDVTGLPNRKALLDLLEEELPRDRGLLMVYLDLDGYSVVNDRYGYSLGDKVLGDVGRRFAGAVGTRGKVARLGSDDFVAVFLADDDVEAAESVLRGALGEPFEVAGDRLRLSATLGFVTALEGVDAQRLIGFARNAMLQARAQGRGSSAVYDPALPPVADTMDTTREEFVTALEHHQLELQYQPIIWARSRRLWGYEALVSWDHPRLGRLAPGAYLDDAEKWGLTAALGRWVTRTACAASAETGRLVTINLGAADLSRSGLRATVMAEVERAGADPSCLVVELTEQALLHAGSAAVTNVLELHGEGIRVALDDFGTGFAALGYLSWLPVDVVKVDRAVIDPRIAEPPPALLGAVVDLAHSVGALALAEGIENEATARRVKEAGFDLYQGFLYGRPAPWSQIRNSVAAPARRKIESS